MSENKFTNLSDYVEWSKNLPEMGIIYEDANRRLDEIQKQIEKYEKTVELLTKEAAALIKAHNDECALYWTSKQIKQAKSVHKCRICGGKALVCYPRHSRGQGCA